MHGRKSNSRITRGCANAEGMRKKADPVTDRLPTPFWVNTYWRYSRMIHWWIALEGDAGIVCTPPSRYKTVCIN